MHPELPEKLYYSIGEVAKAFHVNPSLIRFWEKEFELLQPQKNKGGKRKFTPEDVKNLQLIYHLVKERGFTIEGANAYLKEKKQKNNATWEIIHKLEGIKHFLIKMRDELST
jgi:DNA-binding transcriptional MerR regulator